MSAPAVDRDLSKLAPAFRGAVIAALEACVRDGLDAMVYEACRSDELQRYYFAIGSSKAPDAEHGWHFFGLAVDVISRARGWDVTPEWRAHVTELFKRYGCDWGGDWAHFKDEPHYQWGHCKPSPSDEARALYASGGLAAVWAAVEAA